MYDAFMLFHNGIDLLRKMFYLKQFIIMLLNAVFCGLDDRCNCTVCRRNV